MRDKEFVDFSNAYKQIYEHVDLHPENNIQEEVDIYDQVLEYLLNEGYSQEESNQIMLEIISENRLGSLVKGAKAIAGFVAKRAKTPLRTAATDSLIASTALNPVSTAKVAKTIAKSAPSPAPIVRTVKATPARTAPKGSNRITTNVWNEPTAPSSRINPSKPSGPKISSTKALSGTPSRPALPSAGKTSASVKAPKPTFKPEALPKATKSAEPAGALVRTRAPKPSFKPEALPKATKSAEPAGALVSTRTSKPKPSFKPEALPKVTKSAEPAGALVRTKEPKPTFKPEAIPKVTKSAEPAGALVRTKAPKPTSKTSTSGGEKSSKGGGLTQTVRATLSPAEKSGNMKYPGLEKYATGSSSSGGPGSKSQSAISRNLKTAGIVGTAAAGIAAADQIGKENKKKSDQQLRSSIKTNVYNTMDPDKTVRSRKLVGPAKIGSSFEDAFRFYRKRGDKTFKYAGKEYTTQVKEEIIIGYLIHEGYASDEKTAEAIACVMSEEWIDCIFNEDLGVAASELASKVIGRSGRTPKQVSDDAARLRSATSGGLQALRGALGLSAGEKANAEKIQSRRPQTSLQKNVAKRTSDVLNK